MSKHSFYALPKFLLAPFFFGPNDLELKISFRHRDDDVFVCVEEDPSEVIPFRSVFATVTDICFSARHVS